MAKGAIQGKSFAFAVRIVNIFKHLSTEKREFVLSQQLLRCGTSIGALIREAEQAESRPDFIHKLSIAFERSK
jgi:four helix bundle protein